MKKHPKTSLNNNHQKKTNPLSKYHKKNLKSPTSIKKIHKKNIRKKEKKNIPHYSLQSKKENFTKKIHSFHIPNIYEFELPQLFMEVEDFYFTGYILY